MTKIAIHNGLYVCGGLPRVAWGELLLSSMLKLLMDLQFVNYANWILNVWN